MHKGGVGTRESLSGASCDFRRVQTQQRLRLDIHERIGVFQLRVEINALEKETFHARECLLAEIVPGVPQCFKNVLGCAVIATMRGIAEAIRVTVERARGGDRLLARLAAVHEIEQMRFEPATGDVGILVEILEAGGLREEVRRKGVNGVVLLEQAAVLALVVDAGEEQRQDAVHLQRLEIQEADLGQAKMFVSTLERHRAVVLRRGAWPTGLRDNGSQHKIHVQWA